MRSGRRLSNPPVARRHVSDKRVARPSAVLALQRTAGNRATVRYLQRRAQTDYKGLKLGRNRAGREVEIKRELGTLGGYDDRLQAIAAVRLAGVDPAAVGRDAAGRWHALELTDDFYGATYAPGAALTEVYGLPSAAGIAAQRTTVDNLKAHSSDVAAQLNAANRELYALILGVEGGEVLVNRTSFDRKGGKINITTDLAKDPNAKLGGHGRESRQDESCRQEPGCAGAQRRVGGLSPAARPRRQAGLRRRRSGRRQGEPEVLACRNQARLRRGPAARLPQSRMRLNGNGNGC